MEPGMTAGSGSAKVPLNLDTMREADLKTAVALERATSQAWQQIAYARGVTIEHLRLCLERYQSRTRN
jgi:hypothetical protein